jgi:hypothetical protein
MTEGPQPGRADAHPPLHPLPARPNLEHERKEAKALLRQLRSGDTDAIARVRAVHDGFDAAQPEHAKLADAQRTVAREYGFTSWPRLVRYYGDVARAHAPFYHLHHMDLYEGSVSTLLAGHRDKQGYAARSLAAYVPRFYGMRVADVLSSTVTVHDAQLAVARANACPSWEVLQERSAEGVAARGDGWTPTPLHQAIDAIRNADLSALQAVVAKHPELITPPQLMGRSSTLLDSALAKERELGRATMRPILQWLAEQGEDVQRQRNMRLCGHMGMTADDMRALLEHGADPTWLPPNGIPILEHALLRCWNGEAVDVIAARTVPRRAFWIAAGLGDVPGVSAFLDGNGKPLPIVKQDRPQWDAVGARGVPTVPEPSDEDLLMEAFFVAALNARTDVLAYMIARGVDPNSLIYSSPILSLAVGNGWTPVVECLVQCGADLDLRGWHPSQTPRELAREMFISRRFAEDYRSIVAHCGLDPDAIIAEEVAKPVPEPTGHRTLQVALELAMDDAFREGRQDVTPENMVYGVLRAGGTPLDLITRCSGIDQERFRDAVAERVRAGLTRASEAPLPASPDGQAVLDRMIAAAKQQRRTEMNALSLLRSLLADPEGLLVSLVSQYGGKPDAITEVLREAA